MARDTSSTDDGSWPPLHGTGKLSETIEVDCYYESLAGLPQLAYLDLPEVDDTTREQIVSSLPNLRYGNVRS